MEQGSQTDAGPRPPAQPVAVRPEPADRVLTPTSQRDPPRGEQSPWATARAPPRPPAQAQHPRPRPARVEAIAAAEAPAKRPRTEPQRPPALSITNPDDLEPVDLPEVPVTPVSVRAEQRSPLHRAVVGSDAPNVASLVNGEGGRELLDLQDEHGYTALMNAASLSSTECASITRILLERGASVQLADLDGFTALHWAAACGSADVIAPLLAAPGAAWAAAARNGDTPLHRACKFGHVACVQALLAGDGADPLVRNEQGLTAFDVAGEMLRGRQAAGLRDAVRRALQAAAPFFRTAVFSHPQCMEHVPREGHQESPLRQEAILERLGAAELFAPGQLTPRSDFEPAPLEAVLRAHDGRYVRMIHELAREAQRTESAVPFTPAVQQRLGGTPPKKLKQPAYCDTFMSPGSLGAALRAAGAVVAAVDAVLGGQHRNAFCLVRPPGHHAGRGGLLDGASSCGFCLINNVAVGALHALAQPGVARVAIVDFDVHHGNGTEEIVRLHPDKHELLFCSVHLYDKDPVAKYAFYPGSGAADDMPNNVVNCPLAPLWRAAGSGGRRASGSASEAEGRAAFRDAVRARMQPALRAFRPDLILISAGFDACKGDVGNCRVQDKLVPGIDLEPEDFAFVTERVADVARVVGARVVSVLEGGYGRVAAAGGAAGGAGAGAAGGEPVPGVPPLTRDRLATAVAAHVRAMSGIAGRGAK